MNPIQDELINTVKYFIYNENPQLFEKVDFDNDNIFLDPLLFAYFNSKKYNLFPTEMLEELMQGYFIEKEDVKIIYSYNNEGIAYIPNLGYFRKENTTPFEPICIIGNTNIELLKCSLNLMSHIFPCPLNKIVAEYKIIINENLIEKNIAFLSNALLFIKENSPEHFKLIEKCCKRILLFKSDPNNTNSFATINAHGIAFLNVYQEDYDEVFFIDDIAHQTGHIILTTLFYERNLIFKLDETMLIENIIHEYDHRDIYTLFHALYTYYSIFTCLENCLEKKILKNSQKLEAIARIGFYIGLCKSDLNKMEVIFSFFEGIENSLEETGINTYLSIKNKYEKIIEKWFRVTKHFIYTNQPYNFTYSKFLELNNKNF